jgi:hypothetical protein
MNIRAQKKGTAALSGVSVPVKILACESGLLKEPFTAEAAEQRGGNR